MMRPILESDVWVKLCPRADDIGSKLEEGQAKIFTMARAAIMLELFLHDYPVHLDFRDDVPKLNEIDPNNNYVMDIIYNHLNGPNLEYRALGAAARFIIDEEKIILSAMYPTDKDSIKQRESMADLFLDFLIKENIDIRND